MKRQSQVFGLSTALVLSMILLTACGSTPSNSMNAKNSMSSMSTTSSKSTTSAGSAARGGGSYLDQVIPAQILNLQLFDQNGKTFTLNSLKGKYVVISNFLTSCQEICPMTTSTMRTIGDAVSRAKAESKVDVIEISVDALAARAAQLRKVELVKPRSVIGKNTVEALQSGTIYGFAGQVDGLVNRIIDELEELYPDSGDVSVIATGGLAPLVMGVAESIDYHEEDLTLIGLRLIHERNR